MPYKIGWVLTGDYQLASSRLQGYRIHEYLLKHGHQSHIVAINFGKHEHRYSLAFFTSLIRIIQNNFDVIIFQKPGWMMFKMSELLRLNGIKTIAIQCDPFRGDYENYFDSTIVTTAALKKTLDLPSALVIDDMIEVPPDVFKRSYRQTSKKLKIGWIGQGTGPSGKKLILPFIEELISSPELKDKVEFITISKGEWATHQWSIDSVYTNLCKCDLAIIPLSDDNWSKAKSSNRLTMLMALGIPVIASPVESYLKIASHKENCFIARDTDEFIAYISQCRSQPIREHVGKTARNYVLSHYAPDIMGKKWVSAIQVTTNKRECNKKYRKTGNLTSLINKATKIISRL